jgi:hypothetical protein
MLLDYDRAVVGAVVAHQAAEKPRPPRYGQDGNAAR